MRPTLRGAAAVLAVPALSLSALVATSTSATAALTTDPAPATSGATWLAAQPTDGLVTYQSFGTAYTDPGLSMDVGRALMAVGGHDDVVAEIGTAVAQLVESGDYAADYDYYYPEQPDPAAVRYQGHSANAIAKALAYLQDSDGDTDVIASLTQSLESATIDSGAAAGRLTDDATVDGQPAPDGDYALTLGQALAAQALHTAGSAEAAASRDYLLRLQCADGSFKEALPVSDGADQTCTGAAGAGSIDSTALVILSLLPQGADPEVRTTLTNAALWLQDQQRASGAFSTGDDFGANANSTGLATWALQSITAASPEAAAVFGATVSSGAQWVRRHQVLRLDGCTALTEADSGVIAYSDADRSAVATGGLTDDNYGTELRASAQAVPALLSTPAGSGERHALFTAEYVKAGGKKSVGVTGATPGESLCARTGGQTVIGYADGDGEASLPVKIPARTATTNVSVASAGGIFDSVAIHALGAKKLTLSIKKASVAKGGRQVFRVAGLAPGETAQVEFSVRGSGGSGAAVGGQANGKGVFRVATTAPRRAGTARVKATGAFANRTAAGSFTVTR